MNRTARRLSQAASIALLILLVRVLPAPATDAWLPVSPDDLALKDNPKQPGADAMILYREVDVDAKDSTVNNYMRIKIFTAKGVSDQADIEIPYDKSQESIQAVRARTIRPDGSVVEFQGKTFDNEIAKGNGVKYLAKTFTMPDVQPGCIIEYQYREQFDDRYYQDLGWVIQSSLYTRDAKFSIKPDDSYYALPFLWRGYALPPGVKVQKQGSLYTLEIHDLPGIEREPLMPPLSALEASVEFFYKDRGEPEVETPAQYWKRIGKNWNSEVDHFVDKKKELEAEVARDVAPGDTPEVKLQKLYDRAAKITNLDMQDEKSAKEEKQEQIKPNNNVEDVLKHGYGHSLEINFLLIGLARAAGFEAEDVRVAPRTGLYFYPQREAARDLSAELVWVSAGSKEYYLDPAAQYYPFGVLPWYESAANGIRVSKDSGQMIMTPAAVPATSTIVRHVDVSLSPDMSLTGTFKIDFTGQEAATWRYDDRNEDDAGRKKDLADEVKGWLPVGSTVQVTSIANWDDIEKPLHIEGTLKAPGYASGAMQAMLIPLEIFRTGEVGYFQSQKRENEVDFDYPYERQDDLVIREPAGYAVQNLPAPQKIAPGPVSYEISAVRQPYGIEVKRQLVVTGIRYPKQSYFGLRTFFSLARTDDNARVLFQSAAAAKNN
jgi:Domain of Unknown Function with PDB structure (DUF3857)